MVCIPNSRHPHPGIPASSSSSSSEYAFLSRRHLPRGIGCHTVAQTQPPKLDPAKKTPKLDPAKEHQNWTQNLYPRGD